MYGSLKQVKILGFLKVRTIGNGKVLVLRDLSLGFLIRGNSNGRIQPFTRLWGFYRVSLLGSFLNYLSRLLAEEQLLDARVSREASFFGARAVSRTSTRETSCYRCHI